MATKISANPDIRWRLGSLVTLEHSHLGNKPSRQQTTSGWQTKQNATAVHLESAGRKVYR